MNAQRHKDPPSLLEKTDKLATILLYNGKSKTTELRVKTEVAQTRE